MQKVNMRSETTYTSCNCNQTPTAAHWGPNNLVCYAACNAVLIYDPTWGSGGMIIDTLVGHTKRVNSVRWIDKEVVSGACDNTAIVWTRGIFSYSATILKGHDSNVTFVDGIQTKDGGTVVVTAGMDSTIRVWLRARRRGLNRADFLCYQTLRYDYSICISLKIGILPHSNTLVLACGIDNSKIDLYIETDKLEFALSLKGHEDWVRGLDFITDNDDLLLASSSQDFYIRLWRFTTNQSNSSEYQFKFKDLTYNVFTDSILTGHEGWVYSVHWNPKYPQLLSSSLDKSMVIWELDQESKLWIEKVRVGEVGGNTLGFYGGMFSPSGKSILGHGYHGAFHIWTNENEEWQPSVTIGGHFREVTDLSWEPNGEYLMSVSADQTTRIHAPWSKEGHPTTWHEIARPQIHGYDLGGLALITRYKFASCAEEKIIRIFEAPKNFRENFSRLCGVSDDLEVDAPKGAAVPSLGLSNKAVFTNEGGDDDSHFKAVTLNVPPTEEDLLQNTLWPELQKLYGHGYEVYSLACSPDGAFLASACKATTPEHAAILVWDTKTWKQHQKLLSHSLTVVQISFSPNSKFLLSVSRDRRWSLFELKGANFELVATTDKRTSIHTRIIWCCCWSHDSLFFATGSRDGKVVIWGRNKEKEDKSGILGEYEAVGQYSEAKNEAITALSFAPSQIGSHYFIAVGLESGFIDCFNWSLEGFIPAIVVDPSLAHHLPIRRLAFRPKLVPNMFELASCGNDHIVRIHEIHIK